MQPGWTKPQRFQHGPLLILPVYRCHRLHGDNVLPMYEMACRSERPQRQNREGQVDLISGLRVLLEKK